MSRKNRNRGFTLIELLVAAAIIGVMASLIFVGFSIVVDNATENQCRKNLDQMGKATFAHRTAHSGYFPTGGWGWSWTGDADRGFDLRQPCGWGYTILPYMGQDQMFNLPGDGDPAKITDEQKKGAAQLVTTVLETYQCPVRREAKLYPITSGAWSGTPPNCAKISSGKVTKSDYAMNCGNQTRVEFDGGPSAGGMNSYVKTYTQSEGMILSYTTRGVGYRMSMIASDEGSIPDGLGKTLLYGEKYVSPDLYESCRSGWDNEHTYTGFNNDNYRSTNQKYTPRRDEPGVSLEHNFGGPHELGTNFVFCDGKVVTLSFDIDSRVFYCLGDRGDDERDWEGNHVDINIQQLDAQNKK